jgi:hypothetical protein
LFSARHRKSKLFCWAEEYLRRGGVMLRNRSRAVTGKQSLMTDHSSQPSPTQKRTRAVPSFFGSPRFRAFIAKGLSETEAIISPTSILDTLPFSPFGTHPFSYDRNQPKSPKTFLTNKRSWEKNDSKGVGLLALEESSSKPRNGKVFFGTKLRVQIPPLPSSTISLADQSPISTAENSQLSELGSPRVVTGSLSVREMELSEDYTCVISRGPIPRTTRIFDNCIVESYCSLPGEPNPAFQDFLSVCYTCKKNLEQSKDIYIYRFGPFPSFQLTILRTVRKTKKVFHWILEPCP